MAEKYVMEEFEKQPYEAFFIAGDFDDVLEDGEVINESSSLVTAVDKEGTDATFIVLEGATKTIVGTVLKVRCKGGDETLSKYKITFRILTDVGNKWEIDCKMKVKER